MIIPVDEKSYIKGRNGSPNIKAIDLTISSQPDGNDMVWMDGISAARGIVVNGGFRLDREGFTRLCIQFLELEAGHTVTKNR